jgi:hypothetical protein
LGVKTIGFYPNLKGSGAIRWSPFKGDSANTFIFTPDTPFCKKCKLPCKYHPCMERISINAVFEKVIEFMNNI